jgi:hypothetical protein
MLDGVHPVTADSVTFAIDDPHRTGLALAFGYRVQPLSFVTTQREPTHPVVTRIGAGTRSISGPLPNPPPVAVASVTDRVPHRRTRARRRWLWGTCLALVALLLLAGAVPLVVLRVHRATIDLYPAEEPFSRVVPFAVSADATPSTDPGTLMAHPYATTVVRETDVSTTGTKTVPDGTASGAMTLRSRADGAQTIKAGTALRGPGDVSYIVQADVVVPALDFGKGQLGEATAKVRASAAGSAGNLPAGYTARFTDNITCISGDISGGTDKQVSVVTDDDINRARQNLEEQIRRSALSDINATLPAGVTPLNDFLTKQPPTVISTPAVGQEATSVHVRMSVPVQIPVYDNTAFQDLVRNRVSATVAATNQAGGGKNDVLQNTVTTGPPTQLGIEGKQIRFQTEVHGIERAKISTDDATRIGRTVAGVGAGGVDTALRAEPEVGRYVITYGPSWLPARLRDRMPRHAANIAVRIMATG